jgi:hypothetical protein
MWPRSRRTKLEQPVGKSDRSPPRRVADEAAAPSARPKPTLRVTAETWEEGEKTVASARIDFSHPFSGPAPEGKAFGHLTGETRGTAVTTRVQERVERKGAQPGAVESGTTTYSATTTTRRRWRKND